MELYEELKKWKELLTKAITEIGSRGRAYAKAYKEYRVLLAQEMLKLKDNGIQITILSDIARGNEQVAEAKEQEIIAEALYKSCLEAINSYKIQIKSLEEQLKREYGASE